MSNHSDERPQLLRIYCSIKSLPFLCRKTTHNYFNILWFGYIDFLRRNDCFIFKTTSRHFEEFVFVMIWTADQQNMIYNFRWKKPRMFFINLTTTRAQARTSSKNLFKYFCLKNLRGSLPPKLTWLI